MYFAEGMLRILVWVIAGVNCNVVSGNVEFGMRTSYVQDSMINVLPVLAYAGCADELFAASL